MTGVDDVIELAAAPAVAQAKSAAMMAAVIILALSLLGNIAAGLALSSMQRKLGSANERVATLASANAASAEVRARLVAELETANRELGVLRQREAEIDRKHGDQVAALEAGAEAVRAELARLYANDPECDAIGRVLVCRAIADRLRSYAAGPSGDRRD
jgi:hypothetical protein